MSDFVSVPVHLIDRSDRLRPVKPERVEALAADIDMQGLLQPVVVARRPEGRFRLIAGGYRLAAIEALGRTEIDARLIEVETEAQERFAEIMENVDRQELTKLERAEFLAELDAVWKRLNPAARHGGDRRSERVRAVREQEQGDQGAIFALRSSAAETVGLSRRAFFLALQIADGLTTATKTRVRATPVEDHQADLQKLAALDPEMQSKVCDLIFANPPKASSVAEAILLAEGGAPPQPTDKLYERVSSTWDRLPKRSREAFLDARRDEVLAHARARGWL